MTTLFIRFLTVNGAGKLFRNNNFIHGISPPFGRRNDKGKKEYGVWDCSVQTGQTPAEYYMGLLPI